MLKDKAAAFAAFGDYISSEFATGRDFSHNAFGRVKLRRDSPIPFAFIEIFIAEPPNDATGIVRQAKYRDVFQSAAGKIGKRHKLTRLHMADYSPPMSFIVYDRHFNRHGDIIAVESRYCSGFAYFRLSALT